MELPAHIEALHQQANRWDERALSDATYADSGALSNAPMAGMEKHALRRFQLAQHLRRTATRLMIEQMTEGDG